MATIDRKHTIHELIEQLIDQQNLYLKIADSDLALLPKRKCFVFIANSLDDYLDPLLIGKVLVEMENAFQVLLFSGKFLKNKPNSWLEYYHEPLKWDQILNNNGSLQHVIEQKIKQGISIGLSLQYFSRLRQLSFLTQELIILNLIRKLEVKIVPIHFNFSSQQPTPEGREITVRIGNPMSAKMYQNLGDTLRLRRFIRAKISLLGSALKVHPFFESRQVVTSEVIQPIAKEIIKEEIDQMTYENLVTQRIKYNVYIARAASIPNIIQEIGRLRELTFREVGEGTGKAMDIDEFDLYYYQLFIYDKENNEIAGGYRIGKGDDIFRNFGPDGFYISSLFKINSKFYPILKTSVELGRSFIVKKYQKQHLPLFLLWKGILTFMLQNTHLRYIYGPVSISKHYSHLSKSLIVEFIKNHFFNHQLAKYLQPRTPFKPELEGLDIKAIMQNLGKDLAKLDRIIEEIEPAHIRIPILVRQYVKQNAKFISFNLDPNFSDALDGFMILDLQHLPVSTIEALQKKVK